MFNIFQYFSIFLNISKYKKLSAISIGALVIVGIVIAALVVLNNSSETKVKSYLGSFVSKSKLGIYKRAAVSTDSIPCAEIGRYINRGLICL